MSLDRLAELAQMQLMAEAAVVKAEEQLVTCKKRLENIAEEQIPDVMDDLQLKEFTTNQGFKITLKENLRAHITKANAEQAFQWLRDNGHEKLIRNTIALVMKDDEKAQELCTTLSKAGLHPTAQPSIHWATLDKFAREKLEAGEELPMDLFSVYRQRISIIEGVERHA